MQWWAAVLVVCAWRGEAADLGTEALQAIFPGMDVVATTRHRDDSGKDRWIASPDALAAEAIYQVNGPPANAIERCASENLGSAHFSQSREVRLLLLPWPRTRADYAGVLQYSFIGSNPAGSCWSIGAVIHLARRGPQWEVVERRLVEPHRHNKFEGVQMVDVTGDGVEDLVVEPSFGGPGASGSSLLIFDLSGRRLRPILQTQSRLEFGKDDAYSQKLDPPGSVESGGKSVCFELTVYVKGGRVYSKPRVTHECYPSGTGVDEKQARVINQGLRPL